MLTPFIMLLNCPVMAAPASDSQAIKPTTEIFHKPVENTQAGKRITLYTEVSDQNGVDVVRVYFKSKDAADYTFIAMQHVENQEKDLLEKFKSLGSDFKGQGYSGVLPAPANGSKSLEYLVLVKNNANTVVKSQTYSVAVADNKDGEEVAKEPVQVYTELSETPKIVTGFSDNMTVDVIESGAKFGAVAGLYLGLPASGGGAKSGGTVAASAGEFTTTAAVVSGAAAVAIVGGVVAAAAGGGDSGPTTASYDPNYVYGPWNFRQTYSTCVYSGTKTFNQNGTYSESGSGGCSGITPSSWTDSGTWTLTGSTLRINDTHGVETGVYTAGVTTFQTSYRQSDLSFSTFTTVYSRE